MVRHLPHKEKQSTWRVLYLLWKNAEAGSKPLKVRIVNVLVCAL
jgi:hypothetical protein